MSYANFVGDTPKGDSTRIDTLITERIQRVSEFQSIAIEGDVDFNKSGSLVGLNVLEVEAIATEGGTVAQLNGTGATFIGDISFGGDIKFTDLSASITFGSGDAVRLGSGAGVKSIGLNSITIGKLAGDPVIHDNSIVINSSGVATGSTGVNQLHVRPIRGVAHALGVGVLHYDVGTFEITYSTN